MQHITISGNVVRDPVLRYTPANVPVTTVTVAVNKRFTNAKGNKEEQTLFFDVEFWRERALNHVRYLRKGRAVVITGEMKAPRPWIGDDGVMRCPLEVAGDGCDYIGPSNVVASAPAARIPAQTTVSEPAPVQDEVPQFAGIVDPETGEILDESAVVQEEAEAETPFS